MSLAHENSIKHFLFFVFLGYFFLLFSALLLLPKILTPVKNVDWAHALLDTGNASMTRRRWLPATPHTHTQTGDHIISSRIYYVYRNKVPSNNNKALGLIFTKMRVGFCFVFLVFNQILHPKNWYAERLVLKTRNRIVNSLWISWMASPTSWAIVPQCWRFFHVCVCTYIGRCFRCWSPNFACGIIVCCCCF